jgi:hypothetical protein
MNTLYSLSDPPPYQYNFCHKKRTIHWNGTDTLELYEKNLKSVESFRMLKSQGWIDSVIEYSYNSHGFRCDEFDNRPSALALGCSFTEGIGLHLDQTWPTQLSHMLDLPVWNLGSGGGSIDTSFRMLDHYIQRLNLKFVFMLTPSAARFEYCDIHNGFPIMSIGNLENHESFAKEWLAQTFNADYNTKKTMLAMQKLCEDQDIPIFTHSSESAIVGNYKCDQIDLARDLMHRGTVYQKYVADIMHGQWQQWISNNE